MGLSVKRIFGVGRKVGRTGFVAGMRLGRCGAMGGGGGMGVWR